MNFGVIRQCDGCGQWRHKSWFDVGERHCKACQESEKSYLDRLAEATIAMERHEAKLKGEMLAIAQGEKPASMTGDQWRVIHMLNRGLSVEAIAINYGITVGGAIVMEREALTALAEAANAKIGAVN